MGPRQATHGLALLLALAPAPPPVRAPGAGGGERIVHLVPVARELGWRDDAFLAAVAAAARANGEPIALAVDPDDPWRPELLDFLRRYEASRVRWVGDPPAEPRALDGATLDVLPCASAERAACALARACWPSAERAVSYDASDRASALAAAALAARLRAPLFPCTDGAVGDETVACFAELEVESVLLVGARAAAPRAALRVARLGGPEDVVRWMREHDLRVDFLAATNPADHRIDGDRRLSLAAVVLAAGRDGAVAPLAYDTRWKERFPTAVELSVAPPGAHASRVPIRRGELAVAGEPFGFVTGCDPSDGRWWAQVDRDGSGALEGTDEAPLFTGDTLELGGERRVVDLDADEQARGQALWLTSPAPATVRADLDRFRRAAGGACDTLCLVGWPDALPPAIVDHGQGIDADLVSDLPYADTDGDPFVELALARLVAEDLASATLLACRALAYDDFRERGWARRFATAEWELAGRGVLEGAGYSFAGHHEGGAPIEPGSPLTDVGVIVHGSHAAWTALGATYAWDSTTLVAPCIVESAGCSTASLDQDAEHRSVAARLLRNGAVAFVGNARRGIAQQDLFRSEVWNALLAGATLGEANRAAANRLIVATLEQGETHAGPHYYQLHHHAVYGDPAWRLDRPRGSTAASPARVEVRGRVATIHAPSRWLRIEYAPLAEWGSAAPRLFSWRGAGMSTETWWLDAEKRNDEALAFTAEVRTRERFTAVEPLDDPPAPLGWTGRTFVDEHSDGTRSLYWRTRLIDYDVPSGEVRAEVDRLRFRLTTR